LDPVVVANSALKAKVQLLKQQSAQSIPLPSVLGLLSALLKSAALPESVDHVIVMASNG
jgi:hypothetical protein